MVWVNEPGGKYFCWRQVGSEQQVWFHDGTGTFFRSLPGGAWTPIRTRSLVDRVSAGDALTALIDFITKKPPQNVLELEPVAGDQIYRVLDYQQIEDPGFLAGLGYGLCPQGATADLRVFLTDSCEQIRGLEVLVRIPTGEEPERTEAWQAVFYPVTDSSPLRLQDLAFSTDQRNF